MLFPDLVFVDTSVFIAENFFASDNRINALGRLAKDGKINLVFTEITINEIKNHIKSQVRESWKLFDRSCRVFRNAPVIDDWRRSTNESKEIERLNKQLDEFVSSTHAAVLDYSYCSDSEKVFSCYFNRQKPFGEGKKKDEFPDEVVEDRQGGEHNHGKQNKDRRK